MAKYCSKYYIFKASIKKQNNIIENMHTICILNNFGPIFKIYFTVVNDCKKDEHLKENRFLFKVIKEEETCIEAKNKVFINYIITISNVKT